MAKAGKQRAKKAARRFRALGDATPIVQAPRNAPSRKPIEDPGEWGPATATVQARVMPPPVENMFARGQLTAEQHQAAIEIERVFHWATSPLRAKIMDLTAVHGQPGAGPDALQEAYTLRYKPWADELSGNRTPMPDVNQMARVLRTMNDDDVIHLAAETSTREQRSMGKPHPKTLAIVIAVVVDGRSLSAAAEDESIRKESVLKAFKDGLTLYAERAGWIRRAA